MGEIGLYVDFVNHHNHHCFCTQRLSFTWNSHLIRHWSKKNRMNFITNFIAALNFFRQFHDMQWMFQCHDFQRITNDDEKQMYILFRFIYFPISFLCQHFSCIKTNSRWNDHRSVWTAPRNSHFTGKQVFQLKFSTVFFRFSKRNMRFYELNRTITIIFYSHAKKKTQSLDGFALALAADGRFLYISETVSIYLGLSQVSNVQIIATAYILVYWFIF